MGFITTISFYNDASIDIQKHPHQTIEMIHKAQLGVQRNSGTNTEGIGSHANAVIIQKPRHASDITIYIHAGNTVTDLYDIEAENEWLVDTAIEHMEEELKRLKAMKK